MNALDVFGGAQPGGPFELHFGDPAKEAAAALAGTVVVPLTQLAWIEARGPDAGAFLQGQLSNDVRQVTPARAQLSSCNSPKGRMLAVLHVLRAGDAFVLELHRSVLEATLKRLRMYVLRSKVTLAEAPWVGIGVAGPGAAVAISAVGLGVPASALACAWTHDTCVLQRLGAAPRYSVLAPAAGAAALWQQLAERARPAGTVAWKLLDILAGVPTVYAETLDHFVPQMCNLDALGGISFDKGCYTGQEIVARVHYRGAVKRHMSLMRTPDTNLVPGFTLGLPGGGKGEVVDAAPHPEGGTAALVVTAEG
jgi:hypothetical protein